MAKGGKGGKGGQGGKGPAGGGGGLSGSTMGLIALFAALALVLGGIAVADNMGLFSDAPADATSCNLEGGRIHEHAELMVYLNSSQPFDFSPDRYQVQEGFVHFENGRAQGPDTTVHLHQRRPTLGCLFTTLDWQVSPDRIVTDQGDVYAEDANHEITIEVDDEASDRGFAEPLVGQKTYVVRYEYTGGGGGSGNQTSAR